MPTPVKIALIREGKTPPDSRVTLTPAQAARLDARPEFDVVVQPSPGRCFRDAAYESAGLRLREDLSDRDVLIGVKEVPIEQLIPGKSYFFFSHTHKRQAYNRGLLQAVVEKGIRLMDYELLTDGAGQRYIAFGRFAGMVGAHHGLRAWGMREGAFELPRLTDVDDYEAAKAAYARTDFGDVRVVLTGTGRVGEGAADVLRDMGARELKPSEYRREMAGGAAGKGFCFTQLHVKHYVNLRGNPSAPVEKREFYDFPERYESRFQTYARVSDVLVHGIFWDNRAAAMFSTDQMTLDEFCVSVISDVTCDIAPVTSIPATIRASTIDDPYFGFDPRTGEEVGAFAKTAVTMSTIDNLPNELPKDASAAFGEMFLEHIAEELLRERSDVLERATIARDGALTEPYQYLGSFLAETEG